MTSRKLWSAVLGSLAMGASVCAQAPAGQPENMVTKPAERTGPKPLIEMGPVRDLSFKIPEKVWPVIADAEVAELVKMVAGSYRHEARPAGEGAFGTSAGIPEIHLHAARVDITGLDNAIYFEINLGDRPGRPFRQGILHFYKGATGLRLRVFDFLGPRSLPGLLVGLWLQPDFFPPFAITDLAPAADMPLAKTGDRFAGATDRRYPTTKAGAWDVESTFSFAPGEIRLGDKGFDAAGQSMWDTLTSGGLVFKSFSSPSKATRMPGELLVLDMIPPVAGEPVAKDGTTVALHFVGWLRDGMVFGNSRGESPDAQPIGISVPARFISGMAMGLPGVTKGSLRRLVIPPGLAWADRGDERYNVPPNAWVTFELEVADVIETQATAPGPMPRGVDTKAPDR